jgi:hypothetical protein
MKVLVDIPDQDAQFGMKVLKSLSFIKKASPLPASSLALFKDLQEASKDVRLHKEGKLKLQTARELLNKL